MEEIRLDLTDVTSCVYCGLTADSIDHIPPRSARQEIIHQGLILQYPFIEVDACRECNSALGARSLWTLRERKEYIKKFLRKKYKRLLRTSSWSDSQLGRMSPMMQRYILDSIKNKEIVERRLRH